jgi:hypothetical protein
MDREVTKKYPHTHLLYSQLAVQVERVRKINPSPKHGGGITVGTWNAAKFDSGVEDPSLPIPFNVTGRDG